MSAAPVRPQARDRGAALLTAMLTVALVASLASAALWQQWRSIEVEAAERARSQSLWVLTGALDWARLILREDARSGGADHLGEPWAVPLEEARLSTFLAADKGALADTTDAATQVFLSGRITDLQGRMNVMDLVENGKVSEPALRAFAKLFEQLGLPRSELAGLAENLRLAQSNPGENNFAALMPQRLEQLRWLGLWATPSPCCRRARRSTSIPPVRSCCMPALPGWTWHRHSNWPAAARRRPFERWPMPARS